MKPVRLSADGPITVYMVPDIVADHLHEYCMEFWSDWLQNSPDASKYYIEIDGSFGLCYDESAFIEYLNDYVFPEQPSYPVKGIEPARNNSELPKEYQSVPRFNF